MHSFAKAAVTEHHSLEFLTAEIKRVASGGSEVPDLGVGWVGLHEASLLRLQVVPLTVVSRPFFLRMAERETSGVSSFSRKDTGPVALGPTLMTSCSLCYLLRHPVSRCSHTAVGAST